MFRILKISSLSDISSQLLFLKILTTMAQVKLIIFKILFRRVILILLMQRQSMIYQKS